LPELHMANVGQRQSSLCSSEEDCVERDG
jgi:hypothetical protein